MQSTLFETYLQKLVGQKLLAFDTANGLGLYTIGPKQHLEVIEVSCSDQNTDIGGIEFEITVKPFGGMDKHGEVSKLVYTDPTFSKSVHAALAAAGFECDAKDIDYTEMGMQLEDEFEVSMIFGAW